MMDFIAPYLTLVALVVGLASGGAGAWWVQGNRLDAVKADYSTFVATTKAQGELAKQAAAANIQNDINAKEAADHDYQTALDSLRADNLRLHNTSAAIRIVPPASPSAASPDTACFDRAQLEQSLRAFAGGVEALLGEGDEAVIGLAAGREWVADRAKKDPH